MTDTSLLRPETVVERRGRSRSQLYVDIQRGVMPPPIKISGGKLSAWPAYEIDALNRAEIAGSSSEELRTLVQQLIEQRAQGKPAAVAAT